MSDIEKDTTPRIITVARAVPFNTPCSYQMTVGSRRLTGKRQASYTSHGKATRHDCPARATREIDGKYYCGQHGPSKYQIDPFYDSIRWRNLRRDTLQRDGDRCRYCGNLARQVDHVIPRSKGGVDDPSNLVACCATCNKTAAANLFPSFADKKRWILANKPKKRQVKKKDQRPTAILDQINR